MLLHNFERTYQDEIPFVRILAFMSFYLIVLFLVYENNKIIAVELSIYVLLCMLVSVVLVYRELRLSDISSQVVHGKYSLSNCGYKLLDFDTQHLKINEEYVEAEVIDALANVVKKLDFKVELKNVCIKDDNINLVQHKKYSIYIAKREVRETSLDLIFAARLYEDNRKLFVNWNIYLMPPITKSSIANFIATSPFFIVFKLKSIQNGIHILPTLKSIDLSFFEKENVLNEVKLVNESMIDELVNALERHDINTDNIKLKLNQGININIGSGTIGNVVSGARNMIYASQRVIK